jgi:hypothetical protein
VLLYPPDCTALWCGPPYGVLGVVWLALIG